jgi:hypothetical protein
MFFSLPGHRVQIPEILLAQPGAQYWRSLGISTYCAWYVLTFLPAEQGDRPVTCLLSHDTDVVEMIEAFDTNVASLLCITPPTHEHQGWRALTIHEVWQAIDPSDSHRAAVVFVADDGLEYGGYFCSRSNRAVRQRIVAKVQAHMSEDSGEPSDVRS